MKEFYSTYPDCNKNINELMKFIKYKSPIYNGNTTNINEPTTPDDFIEKGICNLD